MLVAAYRARETAREAPLCDDPWAAPLAGEQGAAHADALACELARLEGRRSHEVAELERDNSRIQSALAAALEDAAEERSRKQQQQTTLGEMPLRPPPQAAVRCPSPPGRTTACLASNRRFRWANFKPFANRSYDAKRPEDARSFRALRQTKTF